MSDWKEGNVKHRDFQHDHSTEVRPVSATKKDRKRWCRGKEGIPHQPVCRDYAEVKGAPFGRYDNWKILVCTECGKELDHYFPMAVEGLPKPKPVWVK